MPRKSVNGNTLTTNILELMYKIQAENKLAQLEADLTRKYKKAPGNRKMFTAFHKMIVDGVSAIEPNQSDEELAEIMGLDVIQFNGKKQDFYDRILAFVVEDAGKIETWEKTALKILKEVDALWDLGLRKHAEARFLKLEKLCLENITIADERLRYSYVLSKIKYYAFTFKSSDNLKAKDKHDKILSKEQFEFIRELENASYNLNENAARYAEPEKWKQESVEFRVIQILALLAKARGEYKHASNFIKKNLDQFANAKMEANFCSPSKGNRLFPRYYDNSPDIATEINFAFYYYLKMEEYHLALLDNHTSSAQNILQELYTILNETSQKSRHYLAGLLLYLKLDLQQAQFALLLKGGTPNERITAFENHFTATCQEVENLDARIEVNRLLMDFFCIPEKPDLKEFRIKSKALEGKLKVKAMSAIKIDLALLQLLICIESNDHESKDQYVRLVSKAAKDSKKETDLLVKFLNGIRKIQFTNHTEMMTKLPELAKVLKQHINTKKHIDNIIMYWLNQFPIVRKLA